VAKCTCGTQGNGICSDWCDSLKPVPEYDFTVTGEVTAYFSHTDLKTLILPENFSRHEELVRHIAVSEDGKGIVAKQFADGTLFVHDEFTTILPGSWKATYDANQMGLPTSDAELMKMIKEHFSAQVEMLRPSFNESIEGVFKVDSDKFSKEWK
jgi:hypothetical protein